MYISIHKFCLCAHQEYISTSQAISCINKFLYMNMKKIRNRGNEAQNTGATNQKH